MKVTIEFGKNEVEEVAEIIENLSMLMKYSDEFLNYEDSLNTSSPTPHFEVTEEDSLILDSELLEAWVSSTYMDMEDMMRILQNQGLIESYLELNSGIKLSHNPIDRIRKKMMISRKIKE